MAQSRDYQVKLYPAHKEGKFVVTRFEMTKSYSEKHIEAAGMGDLVDQITRFAMEYGKGCQASVRCLAPRKPPGFRQATRDLYFNLKDGPGEAPNGSTPDAS